MTHSNQETATHPPAERSPKWDGMNQAADAREFRLQQCANCGLVQYPPRDLCPRCLGEALRWTKMNPAGSIVSYTRLHASHVPFFRSGGPWPVGLIKLDCGPIVFAFINEAAMQTGCRIEVTCLRDRSGQAVLVASPSHADPLEELAGIF